MADDAEEHAYQLAWRRMNLFARPLSLMMVAITLIAGLISLAVVLSVVLFAYEGMRNGQTADIPEVLSNWGGIILGFYFGQFVNLAKDFTGLMGPWSAPGDRR